MNLRMMLSEQAYKTIGVVGIRYRRKQSARNSRHRAKSRVP